MAGLVPATQDLRVGDLQRRRGAQPILPVIMGGRDKPGHDDQKEEVGCLRLQQRL